MLCRIEKTLIDQNPVALGSRELLYVSKSEGENLQKLLSLIEKNGYLLYFSAKLSKTLLLSKETIKKQLFCKANT